MSDLLVLLVEVTLGTCAVTLLVPAATLLLQTLSAARFVSVPVAHVEKRPGLAVLIPAHNESIHIRSTLEAIIGQLAAGDRVVVVADNCTDDTAAIADSANAEVVERFDDERRGKGYALDRGVRHLSGNPPDVVVIVDADCHLHPGSLNTLARRCAALNRPVQCLYLMLARPDASLRCRLSEFGWAVKNHARPLGMMVLGGPCQLMGSGMALPWSVISTVSLASGSIVEDLYVSLELAQRQQAPMFCPDALVTSYFPLSGKGQLAQNMRWEHGHLATIASEVPKLAWRCIRHGNRQLAAIILDLCVPPVAWLLLAFAGLAALAGALTFAGGTHWLALIPLVGVFMLAVAVGTSWRKFGSDSVSVVELLTAPIYAVAKAAMYLRFFWAPQTEWIRSDRDVDADRPLPGRYSGQNPDESAK